MPVDNSTFGYALKTLWPKGIHMETYKDNPFLAMVPKDPNFYGKNRSVPVVYANNSARSANIGNAIANGGNHKGIEFLITRASDYAIATVARETMLSSQNDKGAVVEAYKTEMESSILAVKNSLAHGLVSDGSGAVGRIASNAAGVITLTAPDDIVFFESGMILQSNAVKTASPGTIAAGTGTVLAVDRDAGTFTFTANAGWAPVANDYLYAQGDYDRKVKGLQAWLPFVKPGPSDSFFGVNRSLDATRLAGVRFDGSGMPIEEALIKSASRMAREEGAPSHVFMNFQDVAELDISMADRKRYEDVEGPAGIGFSALVVNGPKGKMRIFQDRNFPRGFAYGLSLDRWCLHSLKEAPHVEQDDGLDMLRGATTDDFQSRVIYYAQLACEAPGQNFVCKLNTAP